MGGYFSVAWLVALLCQLPLYSVILIYYANSCRPMTDHEIDQEKVTSFVLVVAFCFNFVSRMIGPNERY